MGLEQRNHSFNEIEDPNSSFDKEYWKTSQMKHESLESAVNESSELALSPENAQEAIDAEMKKISDWQVLLKSVDGNLPPESIAQLDSLGLIHGSEEGR